VKKHIQWLALSFVLALVIGLALPALAADKVVLNLLGMQQAGMTPEEMDQVVKEFEAKNPGVNIQTTYVAYDALHDKLVTSISGKSPAYDIVLVDDIWFPQFAAAGWLMDVTNKIPKEMRKDAYAASWDIVSYKGKQYGVPYLLDQMYFYYNEKLLKEAGFSAPPKTWEEMVEMAKVMKQKKIVEYPVIWSWGQIEASICNWVTLLGGNGGTFFDKNGNPKFNDEKGVATLKWMVQTLKDGISNPASTASGEEDVRSTFSQGKAAFAINWVYMYTMTNDPKESQIVGQTRMALIPAFAKSGVKSASNNGSMGFAVTARSKNRETAWKFISYLASRDVQKRYAAHVTPFWSSLAKDPDLLKDKDQAVILPMFSAQFPHAIVRPKVPYYLEASKEIQIAIQEALTGKKEPKAALDDAVAKIKKMKK
jgi:multiple sugar transport system substrate-binding protein